MPLHTLGGDYLAKYTQVLALAAGQKKDCGLLWHTTHFLIIGMHKSKIKMVLNLLK